MRKILATLLVPLVLFSCGTKATAKKASKTIDEVEEFLRYSSSIIGNKSLKQKKFKGALTDKKGFEDVGTFEYTTYYDSKKRELVRISNLEITDKEVLEDYYYKDNKLVYIQVLDPYENNYKIGVSISTWVIVVNDKNKQTEKNQVYINKAKILKDAYNKSEQH